MKTLRLILGDQLNSAHSWYREVCDDTLYTLMEIRPEQEYVKHHVQKIVGFFSAMRAFGQELQSIGHRVEYIAFNDADNLHSFEANLKQLVAAHNIERFEYQLPDEYRLEEQLKAICKTLDVKTDAVDTEHFLTTRNEVADFFKGKKTFLMESFYRYMRRKHDVMMDGKDPVGGQWNFDHDNRLKYKGEVPIPSPMRAENDVSDVYEMVLQEDIPHFGSIDASRFEWPLTRTQALEQLHYFSEHLLGYFGSYEDAMPQENEFLFHSRLSFALNIKLLHPKEVVQHVVEAWIEGGQQIPIQNIEGFVRQVLGWREYVRGLYWAKMPAYEDLNFFDNQRQLPSWFWTGDTKMNCLKHAIKGSLKNAWAHHIQRLMVTGNFASLIGAHPDEVDAWYLGIYIDAIQWVEITNTRGMSQFADGGILATKPYVSSASYMHKMGDYCSNCSYKHKLKTEDNACPFNSLYWDFYDRNRGKLSKNPRIGMMYRVWDKMKNQEAILERAQWCKEHIEEL